MCKCGRKLIHITNVSPQPKVKVMPRPNTEEEKYKKELKEKYGSKEKIN